MDAHHHIMILFHKLLARLHGTPGALRESPATIGPLYALLAAANAATADPDFFETQRDRCWQALEDMQGSINASDAEAGELYADIRERFDLKPVASPPTV